MTIPSGERRRRREAERVLESTGAAADGRDGVRSWKPSSGDGIPRPTSSGGDVPQQASSGAGVPQPTSSGDDVPQEASSQDGVPQSALPGDDVPHRPVSRRELRERERRRSTAPVADRRPAPVLDDTAARADTADPPGLGSDDVDHPEPGYTWKHYLALAVVAGVFAVIVSSLTSSELGASGAAATEPTTSPSAPPAPHRGEP